MIVDGPICATALTVYLAVGRCTSLGKSFGIARSLPLLTLVSPWSVLIVTCDLSPLVVTSTLPPVAALTAASAALSEAGLPQPARVNVSVAAMAMARVGR